MGYGRGKSCFKITKWKQIERVSYESGVTASCSHLNEINENLEALWQRAGSRFTVHTHVVLRVEVCRASAHKNVERLCKLPNERTPDGQQELER